MRCLYAIRRLGNAKPVLWVTDGWRLNEGSWSRSKTENHEAFFMHAILAFQSASTCIHCCSRVSHLAGQRVPRRRPTRLQSPRTFVFAETVSRACKWLKLQRHSAAAASLLIATEPCEQMLRQSRSVSLSDRRPCAGAPCRARRPRLRPCSVQSGSDDGYAPSTSGASRQQDYFVQAAGRLQRLLSGVG